MTLERAAREGESPVSEREKTSWLYIPSTTRKDSLVGSRGDYSPRLNTSTSPIVHSVPRGKGEKYPGEGGEIEPETVHSQGVGVPPDVHLGG